MFMKYSIVTRIYTEILINQAVDNFTSSRFRESRIKGCSSRRDGDSFKADGGRCRKKADHGYGYYERSGCLHKKGGAVRRSFGGYGTGGGYELSLRKADAALIEVA
jgi:hypothetical protein